MIVGSDIIEADIVRGKKDSPHVCQYLGAGWVLCLPWVRSKIQTRTGCFNIMNLIEYKHIGQLWMKRTWVCELMVQSQKQQQSHLERGFKECYMVNSKNICHDLMACLRPLEATARGKVVSPMFAPMSTMLQPRGSNCWLSGSGLACKMLQIARIISHNHVVYVHCRDSKSGERGEHVRAIFLPLLC